ncbi:Calcium/calmodulin-dependent protein kinase type 1D [Mortierella alpina]|nr:Calcium/calmodulin-dependent protein kinase type 1D [Mortierella alpina]
MILSELSVSNRHCRFSTDEAGQVLCKDLSTNGTFWNNNLIGRGESIVLSNGDSIWIRRNHRGTNIEKEIAILQSIDHANIIAVVDVIKTPRYMYIFMQMLPGGDLFDYIVKYGPLSELEAKFAIYQILQALQHLHQLNISHRDLKPENLLLASAKKYARLVLTDFGMARQFDKKYCMNTMCGTYAYMAPEVLEVQFIESPGYSCAADCWSLGITLYMILTGAHPFTSHHASEDEEGMRQALYTSSTGRVTEIRRPIREALSAGWTI